MAGNPGRVITRCVGRVNIMLFSDSTEGFVSIGDAVPDVLLDIRYYGTFNFIGDRIDGYEQAAALITRQAAQALRAVSDEMAGQGFRLKIFDAYRPQQAVNHFMRWMQDADDTRMKKYFYPEIEKTDMVPCGYVAEHSGHSRGSTVDLTLFDMVSQRDADMGGTFDYMGERSHFGFRGINECQRANRNLLRTVMVRHGFQPIAEEWWHFTLADEPYPETYFTFPVRTDLLIAGDSTF